MHHPGDEAIASGSCAFECTERIFGSVLQKLARLTERDAFPGNETIVSSSCTSECSAYPGLSAANACQTDLSIYTSRVMRLSSAPAELSDLHRASPGLVAGDGARSTTEACEIAEAPRSPASQDRSRVHPAGGAHASRRSHSPPARGRSAPSPPLTPDHAPAAAAPMARPTGAADYICHDDSVCRCRSSRSALDVLAG